MNCMVLGFQGKCGIVGKSVILTQTSADKTKILEKNFLNVVMSCKWC